MFRYVMYNKIISSLYHTFRQANRLLCGVNVGVGYIPTLVPHIHSFAVILMREGKYVFERLNAPRYKMLFALFQPQEAGLITTMVILACGKYHAPYLFVPQSHTGPYPLGTGTRVFVQKNNFINGNLYVLYRTHLWRKLKWLR